jgi:hypothetical protein
MPLLPAYYRGIPSGRIVNKIDPNSHALRHLPSLRAPSVMRARHRSLRETCRRNRCGSTPRTKVRQIFGIRKMPTRNCPEQSHEAPGFPIAAAFSPCRGVCRVRPARFHESRRHVQHILLGTFESAQQSDMRWSILTGHIRGIVFSWGRRTGLCLRRCRGKRQVRPVQRSLRWSPRAPGSISVSAPAIADRSQSRCSQISGS